MKQFDAIVIGGGVLGCFAARNLRRWAVSTLLLEAEDDVCRGITKANTAIVYAGYDNKPGSLKAEMTVRGNARFERLCEELDVPFSRCGSLMVSFGENGDKVLRRKLKQGMANGVPGLQLLTSAEAREMEPMLAEAVTSALYCPTTGTVNPWKLGIAAFENAIDNGCEIRLNTPVREIRQEKDGYLVQTEAETYFCKAIVNCAGVDAEKIHSMVFETKVKLEVDGTDFLVLDKYAAKPEIIIFHEAESGKGITAVPCVEGNLLLDSPARPLGIPYAASREGMDFIREQVETVLPQVDMSRVIRSFGAVRPNPRREDGKNLPDYCIEEPVPGFISFIGIKTPGLTCADELGMYAARKCAAYLCAESNPDFNPVRKGIPRGHDREIVCQCEQVTESEILEAIRRGAGTVDAVKRRVNSGMGFCQGSRCSYAIRRILEEYGHGTL